MEINKMISVIVDKKTTQIKTLKQGCPLPKLHLLRKVAPSELQA